MALLGGQFKSATHGQFKSAQGGQFDRILQHYKQYDHTPVYARYENEARHAKKGLWSDANPIAPWNFRKNKKKIRLCFYNYIFVVIWMYK